MNPHESSWRTNPAAEQSPYLTSRNYIPQ